jgi:hypothetical protein
MDLSAKVENLESRIQRLEGNTGGSGTGSGGIHSANTVFDFPDPGNPDDLYLEKSTGKVWYWDSTPGNEGYYQASSNPDAIVNIQTGPYILNHPDSGTIIAIDSPVPVNVTAPLAQPGFNCEIWQLGAGQVTVVPPAGGGVYQADNLFKTRKQYSVISLRCLIALHSYLAGDLA